MVWRVLSAAAAVAVCAAAVESPIGVGHRARHSDADIGRECLVTLHGAVGDNRTEDTRAVQDTLDSSECGTVVFPAPGRYLIRPVFFRRDNLRVVIEAGATVVAWPDVDTW